MAAFPKQNAVLKQLLYALTFSTIPTQTPAFCTDCCNLEDRDLTLFLKKSTGTTTKLSRICCPVRQLFLGLIGRHSHIVYEQVRTGNLAHQYDS
jgi:hypothetical protein